MNDGACRRPELNRADPRVSIEVQWHDEVAIDVGAASGDFKRLAHRHDQVGRSELPTFSEVRKRGKMRRISFERAVGHPLLDRGDLIAAQLPGIGKREVTRAGLP